MYVKVPEVRRCCCCVPLRYGIVIFGVINVVFSLLAVSCLVVNTELKKSSETNGASLEVVTSTVLFSILGMSVILNIVLLIGGCEKDISMLRLYNYYAVLAMMAAFAPLIILLSRKQYFDVGVGCLALAMQMYVTVLVRSETVKLEQKLMDADENTRASNDDPDVPDTVTLL